MPNINQMMPSKYLKKEDFPQPALVTIRNLKQDMVAGQQGKPDEKLWIMYFEELEQGLVMKSTNLQLAAMALGSEDTDDWIGKQIVIFADPNVSFGTKLVGGLRLRAVRRKQPEPVTPKRIAPRDDEPGSLGGEFDEQY
jgi:hypothetical protein